MVGGTKVSLLLFAASRAQVIGNNKLPKSGPLINPRSGVDNN
jgi:hypothetical protein